MKITFLGTSHGYSEKNRFTSSAVVTTGGKHYVIDAGAPIMDLLQTYDFDFADIGGIFITHNHQDHYMGLTDFTFQIEDFSEFSKYSFKVYVPEEFPVRQMREYLFGNPEGRLRRLDDNDPGTIGNRVEYINYPDGESVIFDDGNVKITAYPSMHIEHAHLFSVEAEGKKVVFSGDLAGRFPDLPEFLYDKEISPADLLVIEGAHTRFNREEVTERITRLNIRRMIVNHINYSVNTKEVFADMKKNTEGLYPSCEAYDGMTVEV